MPKNQYQLKNWDKGLINRIEANSISPQALSDVQNFMVAGDRMELRRGMKLIGVLNEENGRITGLHSGRLQDGTDILYKTYARKIKYYGETTDDWIEVGTNTIPAVADAEDIAIASYSFLNGNQIFISSPNSGLWQIITANPGSIIDLYDSTKNYKGYITVKENRMFLWNRNEATSVIYLSYIDKMFDDKTDVDDEAIGALGSKNYTGTLAFKAGGSKRSCFAVSFTDGTETFTDNYDGTLTGSAGGTGTINYATGAYNITFNAVTTGAVTSDYSWFDPTSGGLADFTFSATRLAGEGDFFKQGDGSGRALSVMSYADRYYCMHENKIWELNLTDDDTGANNKIYRELLGIPNWRAAVDTGEGVFFIDDTDASEPKVRILTFQTNSTLVIPIEKSPQLNLSGYQFDKAAMIQWQDYVLCACRTSDSDYNNKVLVYDLRWNAWTILDYFVSCWAIYNGALVAGDSISNNVYELFSGYDDLGNEINAQMTTAEMNLGIESLKKTKQIWINGRIQKDQYAKVYASYDKGDFVEIGEIRGNAGYVDGGQSIAIGATVIGKKEIGGGSIITAYNYWKVINLNSAKYQTVKIKIIPQGIGWFDVSEINLFDNRIKQQKLPKKYR